MVNPATTIRYCPHCHKEIRGHYAPISLVNDLQREVEQLRARLAVQASPDLEEGSLHLQHPDSKEHG